MTNKIKLIDYDSHAAFTHHTFLLDDFQFFQEVLVFLQLFLLILCGFLLNNLFFFLKVFDSVS